jgi:hypothetical protein
MAPSLPAVRWIPSGVIAEDDRRPHSEGVQVSVKPIPFPGRSPGHALAKP